MRVLKTDLPSIDQRRGEFCQVCTSRAKSIRVFASFFASESVEKSTARVSPPHRGRDERSRLIDVAFASTAFNSSRRAPPFVVLLLLLRLRQQSNQATSEKRVRDFIGAGLEDVKPPKAVEWYPDSGAYD